ncbi:MAG TPA: heavy-metal-associated domain-containing protein, partial [Streptomyces sp.]|nr:heavy-metal-associated domain-containing protein [Streptomyces sp.]
MTTTTAAVGLATPPGRLVNDVVSSGARLAGRTARVATEVPVRGAHTAAGVARHGASAAQAAPRQVVWTAKALFDPHARRTHRRVWQRHGHAQIEVRGLTADRPPDDRLSRRVKGAVNRLNGVRWAEINAVTGQVLVAFDERRVDLGTVLDAVRAAENAAGTRQEDFSWERPVHPSDRTPLASAVVELAADWVAVNAALAGRILRVPALPRGVRVGLTLLDLQPQLRRKLSASIGPLSTDVLMSLTYSAVLGLSQRPIGPAVAMVHHTQLLAEVLARRAVWSKREPELCRTPEGLPQEAPERRPRPNPLPPGPLETWAARLGPGSFAGALGVLFLTREPRRAADAILAAAPRAARLGRESFAATSARRLARRGIVPLDASAYRRLDRVSALVLDSEMLCSDRPQILTAEAEGSGDLRAVWRDATRLLKGESVAALRDGARLRDGSVRLEKDPRV